jgi:hypothetical protein
MNRQIEYMFAVCLVLIRLWKTSVNVYHVFEGDPYVVFGQLHWENTWRNISVDVFFWHLVGWLSWSFAVVVASLISVWLGVNAWNIYEFWNSFFSLYIPSLLSFQSHLPVLSVCLCLPLITHPSIPPSWSFEGGYGEHNAGSLVVRCWHFRVADSIKDSLYYNGRKNKNRTTFSRGCTITPIKPEVCLLWGVERGFYHAPSQRFQSLVYENLPTLRYFMITTLMAYWDNRGLKNWQTEEGALHSYCYSGC